MTAGWYIIFVTILTVATVLTTEVVVNFENFFEGVLAVNQVRLVFKKKFVKLRRLLFRKKFFL